MSIDSISRTIDAALASAGLVPKPGRPNRVADTIQRALAAAGLVSKRSATAAEDVAWRVPANAPPGPVAPEVPDPPYVPDATDPPDARGEASFTARSYAHAQGERAYKLYVPAGHDAKPLPLIVMLHGCKQGPDDFAAGTRMNEHAQRHGFLVAYPEQTRRANGANCWNWFESAHQGRDGAEPASIAGIVADIAASHAVDRQRVFVAGLSAGASMALIVAAAYPELFAGVAAHSGLPVGSARDVPSAFAAMRGQALDSCAVHGSKVPTIVFHGDADATVVPSNGSAIVEQAVDAFAAAGVALQAQPRSADGRDGIASRRCTATAWRDADGRSRVEDWVVHGGAHAWFGGSAEGSYTDAQGPDASAEIVRFFLQRG